MGRIRILCGLTILLAAACSGGTDGASNDTWEILQTDADADAPTLRRSRPRWRRRRWRSRYRSKVSPSRP
jgi:hypothetical protein